MAIIKCKMCGGDLNITEGISVAECEYCGTRQTVPNVDNEKKVTLFSRANRLRLACEFDKAASVYENIVSEFPEEAEAYWGLVLCRYGIEYVDDPATGKKVPTCHRSSFESILEDTDFEQACENADTVARKVYRDEAKAIEEIRKGILEVSGKEPPYDIFICYKETDENGSRTIDSVLAQDVYDALVEKGYRVFFSRITLEDKLGTEYEPYIFAALNSAKVMLVFGTDYEYFNAVWVKNEWSRFLKLMAQDKSKHLIPCYKDVDAYDLPKEFQKLQAQDLGKVGAVQDLLRGIEKLLPRKQEPAAPQPTAAVGPGIEPLLKRGTMALEDGDWQRANGFFEQALNHDAECAEAYLGQFCARRRLHTIDQVVQQMVDSITTKKPEIVLCKVDQKRLEAIAAKNQVEPDLPGKKIFRQLGELNTGYDQMAPVWQQALEQIPAGLAEDKLFSRAVQFAREPLAGKLTAIQKELKETLRTRLQEARNADEETARAAQADYEARLEKLEKSLIAKHDMLLRQQEERRRQDAAAAEQRRKEEAERERQQKLRQRYDAKYPELRQKNAHEKRLQEARQELGPLLEKAPGFIKFFLGFGIFMVAVGIFLFGVVKDDNGGVISILIGAAMIGMVAYLFYNRRKVRKARTVEIDALQAKLRAIEAIPTFEEFCQSEEASRVQ